MNRETYKTTENGTEPWQSDSDANEVWGSLFALSRLESTDTDNRRFAHYIKTDAVGAAILINRRHHEWDRVKWDGFKHNEDGTVGEYVPIPNVSPDTEWRGVDPGRKHPFHAVGIKHDPNGEIVKPEPEVKCSSKQWQHMSGALDFRRKTNTHLRKFRVMNYLRKTPSAKDPSPNQILRHLNYVLSKFKKLRRVHHNRAMRLNRWKAEQKKQKAYTELVRMIAGCTGTESAASKKDKLIIVYGAGWRGPGGFYHASKSWPATPNKRLFIELRKVFGKRCLLMHEYLTSQICSSGGKCHDFQPGQRDSLKMKDNRQQRYGVKICKFCKKNWQRDVNAARNIALIARYMQSHHGERPPVFEIPEEPPGAAQNNVVAAADG